MASPMAPPGSPDSQHNVEEEEEEDDRDDAAAGGAGDLYSTVVYKPDHHSSAYSAALHKSAKDLSALLDKSAAGGDLDGEDDIYSTVVYKGSAREDEDEESAVKRSDPVSGEFKASREEFSTVILRTGESFVRKTPESSAFLRKKPSLPRSRDEVLAPPQNDERFAKRRGSSSPVHENVAREDPSLKYDLLNQLGKGSYGAVYKARDRRTSEFVAIKVISLTEGEEGYDEIRGEIEMLQQCNHPNVVRYLGSYQGEEYLWIVMEYCGGGSVGDLMSITDEPLEEVQIAYICREALKGLAYLHAIFKVHRDIKGGNILLTEQGEVKLGDFGVAAQLTRTMSKRNTFIGTPHWMAPEVIQESRYDGKVDVWALGVSAIEMAEGLPPRSNVHPMRVLFMISREPAPMLEDKEKWSLVFHDFVAKCLTKEPRLRPTATALLQHKFIEKCKGSATSMLPRIERARALKELSARTFGPEQATVSSGNGQWSWERGQTVKMHESVAATVLVRPDKEKADIDNEDTDVGDFGTMVVHRTSSLTAQSSDLLPLNQSSTDLQGDNATVKSNAKVESENVVGEERHDEPVIAAPIDLPPFSPATPPSLSPNQQLSNENQTLRRRKSPGDGATTVGGTTPRNLGGFALHDKLVSIYAAGNTVPIPFLRATDISAIALLSDDVLGNGFADHSGAVALQTVEELYNAAGVADSTFKKGKKPGTSETPLPASVYQSLATSSTLQNLARALAYHKRCYEEMPLQGWQAAQEERVIGNLSDTLRTILRL
ncbi:serine/threonine-protein kinase 4 [Selaginella moellendorffii]|uniref:serine/threonine-protein kinase 4 n=1 Tax=Selaginella moellendorffii TaxID=88036 RepID=UPI000D1C60D6|nr:serine/threonine-protein kinase 4 [Selaginella moellendorffii]|eukprot:XP_024545047.1 serine/threonine-protein kinase 4 [Selaginella moellendorffii]